MQYECPNGIKNASFILSLQMLHNLGSSSGLEAVAVTLNKTKEKYGYGYAVHFFQFLNICQILSSHYT